MSILGDIFRKIFPSSHPAVTSTASPAAVPSVNSSSTSTNTAPNNVQENVDVEAILNGLSKNSQQALNWRVSIVDLLKLLNIDSSLQARKDLALELGYQGDTNDSASMNIWLHKQVMNKLAANGGKVPAELKD